VLGSESYKSRTCRAGIPRRAKTNEDIGDGRESSLLVSASNHIVVASTKESESP
jgi:hypothetical protein